MELSKKVGICTAFIFYFLDAFVCTLHSVVGSFENDFNHFSIFLCWICFDVRKRWLGPNHWVKLNILTQIISSSSQVSAGHGVQLALQFNGKVSRRDDGLEIYQDWWYSRVFARTRWQMISQGQATKRIRWPLLLTLIWQRFETIWKLIKSAFDNTVCIRLSLRIWTRKTSLLRQQLTRTGKPHRCSVQLSYLNNPPMNKYGYPNNSISSPSVTSSTID